MDCAHRVTRASHIPPGSCRMDALRPSAVLLALSIFLLQIGLGKEIFTAFTFKLASSCAGCMRERLAPIPKRLRVGGVNEVLFDSERQARILWGPCERAAVLPNASPACFIWSKFAQTNLWPFWLLRLKMFWQADISVVYETFLSTFLYVVGVLAQSGEPEFCAGPLT